MNKVITTIAMCLVAIAAVAQEKADIEVSYTASRVNLRDGSNITPNQYIMLANAKESKFYSPITEYLDSLQSTPEGDAKYKEMTRGAYMSGKMDDIPRRDGSYYIFKSMANGKMMYYDMNGIEKYCYEEEIPRIEWELSDSTKTILGYECQMATGNLHGRKWTVWFTPEVPLMTGPWKFSGLPGLILEATDDSGLYNFAATGIQQTHRQMTPMYSSHDYEKTTRTEFLRAKRQFTDNPMGTMNTQLSSLGISIGGTGDGIKFKTREEVDFIETDY